MLPASLDHRREVRLGLVLKVVHPLVVALHADLLATIWISSAVQVSTGPPGDLSLWCVTRAAPGITLSSHDGSACSPLRLTLPSPNLAPQKAQASRLDIWQSSPQPKLLNGVYGKWLSTNGRLGGLWAASEGHVAGWSQHEQAIASCAWARRLPTEGGPTPGGAAGRRAVRAAARGRAPRGATRGGPKSHWRAYWRAARTETTKPASNSGFLQYRHGDSKRGRGPA
jgi:hypothetical protein